MSGPAAFFVVLALGLVLALSGALSAVLGKFDTPAAVMQATGTLIVAGALLFSTTLRG